MENNNNINIGNDIDRQSQGDDDEEEKMNIEDEVVVVVVVIASRRQEWRYTRTRRMMVVGWHGDVRFILAVPLSFLSAAATRLLHKNNSKNGGAAGQM